MNVYKLYPHTKGFSDLLRDVQNDNKRHILGQHLCADSVLEIPAGKNPLSYLTKIRNKNSVPHLLREET